MYPSNQFIQMKKKLLDEIISKKRKVKEVSEILGVSRQSISKWLAQYKFEGESGLYAKKPGPKKGLAWNKTGVEIEDIIVELARDNPFKGPVWLSDELYKEGIELDQSTVYRIIKRRGVRYYYDYKHKRRKKKAYCLDNPGREVQVDCSFPWGYQRKAVIYDGIDDCSRWVCGKVYKDHTSTSTILFLSELIKQAPFKIEAIRTDQGREFLNKEVKDFLQQHKIEHKINPPYTPQHNGKIERFHQTLKNNAVLYNWYFTDDLETLNYKFSQFLFEYNYMRKHTGLGMNKLTPAQKIAYVIIHNSFNKNVNLILQQNKNIQKYQLFYNMTIFLSNLHQRFPVFLVSLNDNSLAFLLFLR
jgi:transposase InsO family protein